MSLEHIIIAVAGLAMTAFAVIRSAFQGFTKAIDEAEEQATNEQLENIEESKDEQLEDYKDNPDGLADDTQSVIDSLRSEK